jgi:GNAT superfamily N-acetyltransferase
MGDAPPRAGSAPPAGYTLRPSRDGDIADLCALSWRAGQLFALHGYPLIAAEPPMSEAEFVAHYAATAITVAEAPDGGRPAGFAATLSVGGWLWLAEISVDPEHGRKGVGTALVDHVARLAASLGLLGIGLSTFREVPFNAPFYRRLGFSELAPEAAPPELRQRWRDEIPPGVAPGERLLMTRGA